MKNSVRKHYALVPAKLKSSRCKNKNWRPFLNGMCLVDYVLNTIPDGLFNKIIISTDKADYKAPSCAIMHLRNKRLASKRSCVVGLMQLLIRNYGMSDNDYLWLLNPTSPFRLRDDFNIIACRIKRDVPGAIISAIKISPFIWNSGKPLFKTSGKRRGTDDFKDEYFVENGMFYVVNIGHFRKRGSWYGKSTVLHEQDSIFSSVDIDTEQDYDEAKKLGHVFISNPER